MNIMSALLLSSLAGFSTFWGGLIIFIPIAKEKYHQFIAFNLSFSCLVMLGISILDLLPEGFKSLINIMSIYHLIILLFLSFVLGYVIIKLLNVLTLKYQNNLYKLGIMSMIVLMIHNFPEGILTFLSSIYNIRLGVKLSIAIALHNIPEGISIAVPIYYSTKSKAKALKMTLLSGLAEPCGAFLAYMLLANRLNNTLLAVILIVVAFLMINLSIEEIYPKIDPKEGRGAFLGMTIGILVILLNALL